MKKLAKICGSLSLIASLAFTSTAFGLSTVKKAPGDYFLDGLTENFYVKSADGTAWETTTCPAAVWMLIPGFTAGRNAMIATILSAKADGNQTISGAGYCYLDTYFIIHQIGVYAE